MSNNNNIVANETAVPATKVASHDMQLAILINMGFDAIPAEQALERNEWKVNDSIDYLLAAGIMMKSNEEESNKSAIERARRLEISEEPPSFEGVERQVPIERSQREAHHHHDDEQQRRDGRRRRTTEPLVDDWIDEEPAIPIRPTRPRTHGRHEHDNATGTTQMAPPHRHAVHQSHPPRHGTRPNARQQQQLRHTHPQQVEPQQRRGVAQEADYQQEVHHYRHQHEPTYQQQLYKLQDENYRSNLEYTVPDNWVVPEHSFEDRLGGGFSVAGVPTMASDTRTSRGAAARLPGAQAVYGGGSISSKEIMPPLPTDDISVRAVAPSDRPSSPNASVEVIASSSNSSPSDDEERNRKHIRRLYILVGVAIVLVLACTGVAVALVLTLGNNDNASEGDTPVMAPTTTDSSAPRPTTSTVPLTKPPASTPSNGFLAPSKTLPPVRNETTVPSPSPAGPERNLLRGGDGILN